MPELQFKGKEFVYNHHLTVPYRPLVPDAGKSVGEPSLSGNLIIHGDNLHALKALLPLYAGKVDCIFIDPPYNTGKENWCYNDNVNGPMMKEWLSSNPVNAEDMLRHDKWCAMMYPRLRLLHELLSPKGSLWMTLDDNEVHRAALILDEIFGDQNALATVVWEKADSPRMDADYFSNRHDSMLSYAKDKSIVTFHRIDEDEEPPHYNLEDTSGPEPRKYYLKPLRSMGGEGERREARPNLYFPLKAPDGTEVYPKLQSGEDGAWRWSRKKVAREGYRIEWKTGGAGWTAYYRIYADTAKGRPPETIFYNADVGSSRNAKAELKKIFPEGCPFDNPKPTGLVEQILEIATNLDSVVLDSFAGSGTTAHAVLTTNANDGGNRRFLLAECEDYADAMTAERVRRVIRGYNFQGVEREELFRDSLTWTKVKKAASLVERVSKIEEANAGGFDKISKVVKDGDLIVTGEKNTTEHTEGLGGEFAFCTLGPELNVDKILTGESLPDYLSVGAWLFHTATGEAFESAKAKAKDWYLGESAAYYVWLVYRPDLDFLKSADAALTLALAEKVAKAKPAGKKHLVFAPAKYVPNNKLLPMGVEYAPLPFALYRIEKG